MLTAKVSGRKLASELRRRRRRLEEEGRFSFEVVDGREQLPVLLDEGFAVEAAGWKGEQDKAISSRSEMSDVLPQRGGVGSRARLAQARLPSPRRTTLCVRLLHRSRWDPLPLEDGLRPGIRQVRSRDDPAVRDAGAGVLDRPPQLRVSRSGRAVEAPSGPGPRGGARCSRHSLPLRGAASSGPHSRRADLQRSVCWR